MGMRIMFIIQFKRLSRLVAASALTIGAFGLAGNAHAVNGIAVSTQINLLWPTLTGGDIMRYTIRNNDVVSATKILDGGGGDASKATSCGRFPTFNLSGTQIAFMHAKPTGNYVAVMDIDGKNIRDLAQIPTGSGNDNQTYLEWTSQSGVNWIYYMLGGGNSQKEGNKHLWRVNVDNPQQNQEVAVFPSAIWQFGMSIDASKIFARIADPQPQIVEYTLSNSGSLSSGVAVDYGQGCAVATSPSGKCICYASGGSHIYMIVKDWDKYKSSDPMDIGMNSYPDINNWAVNSSSLATHCVWSDVNGGIDVSLGLGTDCNRWSCNSDKWLCFFMGWPEGDGASGRYAFCGSNQVLINWQDHVAVNASKNARACAPAEMSSGCDKDAGPAAYHRNDAGDFYVSGPSEDINADLRALTGPRPEGRGRDTRNTGGLPRFTPAGFSLDIADAGPYRVRILDCAGAVRAIRSGTGPGICAMPAVTPPAGIALVTLTTRTGTYSYRCMMSNH
jgi:hypothetical protein